MQPDKSTEKSSGADKSLEPLLEAHKAILAFDGSCSLCNRTVRFILRWERESKLSFLALQSGMGSQITAHFFKGSVAPDSIILIQNKKVFVKSEAALRIAALMGGVFRFLLVFQVLPVAWRDAAYDWVARNRKRWFGSSAYCGLHEKIDQKRFIDLQDLG